MITDVKILNELLAKACTLVDALEKYAKHNHDYQGSDVQSGVDDFFNEVDTLMDN